MRLRTCATFGPPDKSLSLGGSKGSDDVKLSEFVRRKMDIAAALDRRECGGSYMEACMIVAAVISGLAADLWPGDGIDRARFVELWVHYGSGVPTATWTSVPLLTQSLRVEGRVSEAQAIEASRPEMFGLGYSSRVLVGTEVDMAEADVLRICPSLTQAEVRLFAYPNVFYKEFRCGLVHEYRLGDAASDWPMTAHKEEVSYFNMAEALEGAWRRIHFDMPWLTNLAVSVAGQVEPDIGRAPLATPGVWWLHEK